MSKQTTTSRKGHPGVNRLTRSCHGRWKKHRTKYTYDAYGSLIAVSGSTSNNRLYCGMQWDSDLNLYYDNARYLNTGTGRFWTADSVDGNNEDPLSLHKYLYVADNPVNRIDPSGHDAIEVLAVVSIAVVIDVGIYQVYSHILNNQIDQGEVNVAISGAKFLVARANRELARWNSSDQADYSTWFGAPDSAREATVRDCYKAIANDLNGKITWHKTSQNVFAYVYPGGPVEIWLGPLFWKAPDMGVDSKAGTIVHELSHEVLVTQDYVYGTSAAKSLATTAPDQAIHNADNYEYFGEKAP